MKIELEEIRPAEIEKRSFEIITGELGDVPLVPGTEAIVKRCIHTSADFEYAKNLVFSENVVEKAMDAIRAGAVIVTDTQMGMAGINKKKLAEFGGEVLCFMSDEDVARTAGERGTTRDEASMDKAAELDRKLIFAIGNAPTALVRLYELIQEGKYRIGDICYMVGISSQSYFSKLFFKQFGITPKDFEKQCQKKQQGMVPEQLK